MISAVPETDTYLNTLCKRPIISRLKKTEWLSCHVEMNLKRSYRNCHLLTQLLVFLNPYNFLWIWEAAMTSVMNSGPLQTVLRSSAMTSWSRFLSCAHKAAESENTGYLNIQYTDTHTHTAPLKSFISASHCHLHCWPTACLFNQWFIAWPDYDEIMWGLKRNGLDIFLVWSFL